MTLTVGATARTTVDRASRALCAAPGGGTAHYAYVPQRRVDVFVVLLSDSQQALAVLDGCNGAAASCTISGQTSLILSDREPGAPIHLAVQALGSAEDGPHTVTIREREIASADAPCDPDELLSRCAAGLLCMRGPEPRCTDATAALASACAAPAATLTGSGSVTVHAISNFMSPSCQEDYGTHDTVVAYTATGTGPQGISVSLPDVIMGAPYTVSARRTCTDAASESGCLYAGDNFMPFSTLLQGGETVYLFLSAHGPAVASRVTIQVTQAVPVANGAFCGLGLGVCAAGLVCASFRCANPASRAPVLEAATFLTVDRGDEVAWRYTVTGADSDGVAEDAEFTFLDAQGRPVPVTTGNASRTTTRTTLWQPAFLRTGPYVSSLAARIVDDGGFTAVRVVLHSDPALGLTSNSLTVARESIPALGDGAPCSMTDPRSICASDLKCLAQGTATTCQNPATAACATAPTLTGYQTVNYTGAPDVFDSCTQGARDRVYRHVVTQPRADLYAWVGLSSYPTVSVRTTCDRAATQVSCGVTPLPDAIARDVTQGTALYLVVDAPSGQGMSTLEVQEVPVVGAGSACSTYGDSVGRCAEGLVCGASLTCATATAPVVSSTGHLFLDANRDGTPEAIRLTTATGDGEGDLAKEHHTLLGADGEPVPLFQYGSTGPTATTYSTWKTLLPATSTVSSWEWVIDHWINTADVKGVGTWVEDSAGLMSTVVRSFPAFMPVVDSGGPCDTSRAANICAAGLTCRTASSSGAQGTCQP